MVNGRLWIAFDCETTGFPPIGRLIEISAILFNDSGKVLDEFHAFVFPPVAVPSFITRLTGITSEMLTDAESASVVLGKFVGWLNPQATLVAHNALFDVRILVREEPAVIGAISNPIIDSLPIAKTLGCFPNNKLETIGAYLCPEVSGYHRAAADSQIVIKLLLHAIDCRIDVEYPELFSGQSLRSMLDSVQR
tara:strand:- start:51246 stop:51824 length:579 start_codon:yes stop_codon:yes gene_type:complete